MDSEAEPILMDVARERREQRLCLSSATLTDSLKKDVTSSEQRSVVREGGTDQVIVALLCEPEVDEHVGCSLQGALGRIAPCSSQITHHRRQRSI